MSIFIAIRDTNLKDLNEFLDESDDPADLLQISPFSPTLENNTLHLAARYGNRDIVEALLDHAKKYGSESSINNISEQLDNISAIASMSGSLVCSASERMTEPTLPTEPVVLPGPDWSQKAMLDLSGPETSPQPSDESTSDKKPDDDFVVLSNDQ